jgi:2'-5' RNA ligase
MTLVAVDIAILPPPEVTARAVALSAALPREGSPGLQLDEAHLPHVTLMQLFIRAEELELAFAHVDDVLREEGPLRIHVTGGGKSGGSVWMAIERTPALVSLHERLMAALRGVERANGGAGAFHDGDARLSDVLWVTGYRLTSSFGAFTPHITLGHDEHPPAIEPFSFDGTIVAACHLGRFCTCRLVLRSWRLGG